MGERSCVDQATFERLCEEDPTWHGSLVGGRADVQSPCVTHGMEPIDVVARRYENGPRGRSSSPEQAHAAEDSFEIRNVPHDELDALEPSIEVARAPGETSRWAVIFRAVVVETAAGHAILHGDMLLPLRLVLERRSHLKRWDVITGRDDHHGESPAWVAAAPKLTLLAGRAGE